MRFRMPARNTGNPYSTIKSVEKAQELLDLAFSRSMKIKPPYIRGGTKLQRQIEFEKNRVNTAANVLSDRLHRMVNQFPTIDMIHPFYTELTDILVGTDQLKRSLGRIYGTIDVIRHIAADIIMNINESNEKEEIKQWRGRAFGRLSDLIYRLRPDLGHLEKARETLAILPGFDPIKPCVVVAGVPNVGKSSFVSAATSGKPEIAAYPFTTKKLVFGHINFGFLQVQFCDTPGLLDRSLSERNPIELQAIAALKHISDVLLIVIDPSIAATYTLDDQLELVDEFTDFYPGAELMIIINKVDLLDEKKLVEVRQKVRTFLEDYGLSEEEIEATPFISSFASEDINSVKLMIEHLVKNKVLKSSKFRNMVNPTIAEDQYLLEELPEDYKFTGDKRR